MIRHQVKKIINRLSSNDYKTLNIIELSRGKLLHNFNFIQKQHSGFTLIPVLKANAYGHGLEKVAEILNAAKCDLVAVDGYFEAAKIKDITIHRILVLGYIKPENVRLLDTKKCSYVVQDIEGLKAFSGLKKPVNIHIELNTGMNRLGLQPNEMGAYLEVLKSYPNLCLEGIMTHLADADNESDDSYTDNQVKLFDDCVRQILGIGFKPRYIHIAQTAGSTKAKSKYANAIRLGIGLYGINPLKRSDGHFNDLKALSPVLTLKSTVVKVTELNTGDKVSYNGIFKAPKRMKIGVLPLGYYEGIPRELSNKGFFTVDNNELPIVGRVCMNHTMIDLKDSTTNVGDEVIVISDNPENINSIAQICVLNHLFNYSLMTGLSDSTRRVIIK